MEKLYENSETGCCPRFDPAPWNEKEVSFEGKLFLKDKVKAFMHIPLNFGGIMVKNMEAIKNADALVEKPLMLYDSKSAFGADIFIEVTKEISGRETVKMPGKFLSKVFEGNFKDSGKWIKEMQSFVKSKGKIPEKMYFFYTTCPKCAEHYGKNYTVIFAKIE
ncbi:MAG: hypothetical protein PHH08_00635 [Candidatus ainarchaeum sp.]|nr:hypothetical protein [Candidatus ainarchaeum sp.]